MAEWLRRAGHGRSDDGALVTWSVAEGRRGRRWREVVVDPAGGVRSSLLLELDPEGRFSHLELSTAAGLLTLHPESDGTLHGNAVMADGVRHVRGVPWDRDGIVQLEGSPITMTAALPSLSGSTAGSSERAGILIGLDLGLRTMSWNRRTEPVGELVEREATNVAAAAFPDLQAGTTWPLEESD